MTSPQPKVKLTDCIGKAFYKIYHQILNHDFTHYWFSGGRGSLKSSFISIMVILLILKDPSINVIVFRKVGNTIKNSVFEQIAWAIEILGLKDFFIIRQTPPSFAYKKTGQKVLFWGLDDPAKKKSVKIKKGYYAVTWFEELEEFDGVEEITKTLQSIMRGGEKFWVFYSYNPPESLQSWVNSEAVTVRPDKILHKSCYLQAPPEWLGNQFMYEAAVMAKYQPRRFRHQYLGEVTGTGGEVFKNLILRPIEQAEIQIFDNIKRGLDFGFANDPTAYMTMHLDKARRKLYIYGEFYKVGCPSWTLAEHIRGENPKNRLITTDVMPTEVFALQSYGINVMPAKKGPGSRESGYRYLTDEILEIIIDPMRCPNAAREFSQYELKKDKNGNYIANYPDGNDHAIDAVRYAVENSHPPMRIRQR